MAGKGGGAWKVAYADFVTAMMAFFLVMWIVAQNKPVKESVAKYFNDPMGTSGKPGRSDAGAQLKAGGALASAKTPTPPIGKSKGGSGRATNDSGKKTTDPTEQPSRSPGRAGLAAINDENRAVGSLVPFSDDSTELDDRGKMAIDQLLPELLGKSFRIEVRGHTSGRSSSSSDRSNDVWGLSYARSLAAMKYLVDKGIPLKRIRLSQAASNEPNMQSAEGVRTQNGRVEIFALNELVYDPVLSHDDEAHDAKTPDIKAKLRPKGFKSSGLQ